MPTMIRLDTLKVARRITAAGLPREAAEAIVEGLGEADKSEVATKTDIAEVKAAIADLRAEMFRFMLIQGASIIGLTVALVKFLPG